MEEEIPSRCGLRRDGSELAICRDSASLDSIARLVSEKRERKVEVDSEELDESDRRVSELSKRVWWRTERRSSID